MIISLVFAGIGWLVQRKLRSKFQRYGSMPFSKNMSGAEVARAMLNYYGVNDVEILQGQGMLTDHYHPLKKQVVLSPDIYAGRSVMAAAVAAHECGHAVQHANAYIWLTFRSAIVPIVQISASLQQYFFMFAFVAIGAIGTDIFLLIAIVLFGITALFATITLPVEFDASRRALVWLDETGTLRAGAEYDGAKDALFWAAMTYVTAALAAIVQLIYLLLIFMGNRR